MGFRERFIVRHGDGEFKDLNFGKIAKYAFGTLIFLILFFGSFYTISTGYRGVLTTFGKPSMESKVEGLHFKIPIFQSVEEISVRTTLYTTKADAASKDLQNVYTEIGINYNPNPKDVPILYQTLGLNYETNVIAPMVQEVVSASTAKFTAEELITKREAIKALIKNTLIKNLNERYLYVTEVSMTDFDFSKSFNDAIEAKVEAEQLKLKAERDLERIIVEKEQKIAQAQAEAESLRLQKQEITPMLLELRKTENQAKAIEKWDGILPKFSGGIIPFLDVASIED